MIAQGDFEIREIAGFDDIDACMDLQRQTWGLPDIDLTPSRLFVIARYGGTPALGAFDDSGLLLGFLHTLSAQIGDTPAFYSHMLAVRPDSRDRGIGRALKLAQRDMAIAAGVPLVVWTFDPLQSRNAHFNINRLGVVARRYVENFYGEHHSSVFDSGLGSDRLFVEWWVSSPRVTRILASEPSVVSTVARVCIPSDINILKTSDHDQALAWRVRVRREIQEFLANGRYVHGFEPDPRSGISRYLLADESELDHEIGQRDVASRPPGSGSPV